MKTYITYPTNPTSESLFLLSDEDNFKNSKKILSLDELGFITNKDILRKKLCGFFLNRQDFSKI